jgi:hypothetical protein
MTARSRNPRRLQPTGKVNSPCKFNLTIRAEVAAALTLSALTALTVSAATKPWGGMPGAGADTNQIALGNDSQLCNQSYSNLAP